MKRLLFLFLFISLCTQAQKFTFIASNKEYNEYDQLPKTTRLDSAQALNTISNKILAFNTRLKRDLRHISWEDLKVFRPRITVFVESIDQAKPHHIIYYITYQDTTVRNTYRSMYLKLIDEKWHADIQKAISHSLKDYSSLPKASLHTVSLNYNKKDFKTYISNFDPKTTTSLELENFDLTEVPQEVFAFKNLKKLSLKDNYIDKVTIRKKDFPQLENLSFQGNLLNEKSGKFWNIKTLNLIDNQYESLPKIGRKTDHILLATNYIKELRRKDIKRLRNSSNVNLYLNQLTYLPKSIKKLKKTKEMDLYRNQLQAIPKEITKMKSLETLAISYNKLNELPDNLHVMSHLKTLYAHHNHLKQLPSLPSNLELLDVGFNRLEAVDQQIKSLKNLKSLELAGNKISDNIDFILDLPKLEEIYIWDNPIPEDLLLRLTEKLQAKQVTVK
jgi:Leucine-rich repeat (LRR) protein